MKKLLYYIKTFFGWVRYRLRRKYKRLYEVYNGDAPEHVGLKLRGLPRQGSRVIIKGGTEDTVARHFEIHVLNVFKLNRQQKYQASIPKYTDAYYVDGKYNDLEIKRIH